MKPEKNCCKPVGRPREFCTETALRRALHLFWSKGYEGTSLTDLTEALGVSRPSLYAAFGNKESIFRRALELYACEAGATITQVMQDAPTAREALEEWMCGALAQAADSSTPAGCLLVAGALTCSEESAAVRDELIQARAALEALVRRRFEQAVASGELPPATDAADLARFYATVAHGMSVQSAGGATAGDLRGVVRLAFEAWPGGVKPKISETLSGR